MGNGNYILNGPYLMDPTASRMTIAWEMEEPEELRLLYNENGQNEAQALIKYEREPGCKEYPQGCYLYTAVLHDLKGGTRYAYQIYNGSVLLEEAEFQTLAAKPQRLRLVTLSDSHLFYNDRKFADMIQREKPDFILHGGDISFGTGYQHEQYVNNWFRRIPEVLKQVPVYYISGNHDDGPFFNAFFAKPQSKTVHTADGGYSFSFDYGCTHFTMVNSNPWGLFEMNAVNSGIEADENTRRQIRDILEWVEADLTSPAARAAKWRVLMLHHPYTDTFNNRYIVPIAERCQVDLVIGGHLHYYIKSVSIDPAVGARTVYVCQGSAQDPEASLETNDGDKRLLGDFPEVIGMGRNNYGLLDIDEDVLQYRLMGFSEEEDQLVDTIKLTQSEPELLISNVELRRLDNLGNVEIRAHVKNVGRSLAEVGLQVLDNKTEHIINLFGNGENSHVVVLEAGEEQVVTAFYHAVAQGEHIICVGEASAKVLVFEPTQLSFAHMKLFAGQDQESDCLLAGIEATNNLDREVLVSIPLYVNQRIAEARNVFFRGHEKKYIEFRYRFDQGGSYQVSIADQLPKEIEIEGGIRIVPRIQDKSGHGHYALLQGTPKVIQGDNRVEVCLEKYGDYIEIPASEDLMVDHSFSGMVWSRIERLARANEMSHNPLMVRGKSVGWGATYLLRMVVERAGGLKWGVCHDITEYSWQGGRAALGAWAQYTMTFDKERGGDSYCNGENVAHVSGIDEDCKLRQWEKEPIFVGYSYIGHVIPEIGRPKYFTHLPGKVSQVRFYKTGLTADENAKVLRNSQDAGPQADNLAVWLDFHDILTVGTHTTEWRHPAIYDPAFKTQKKLWQFKQLKTKAVLPLQAGLKATVEVSDDGATVKESMKIILKDGTNYIDLANLPASQYLRIITEFSAEVGPEGTFIPELQEYQVTAFNETDFIEMLWSTRTAWEKGSFTGALGFAPRDRLRDFPEYTDVIHG